VHLEQAGHLLPAALRRVEDLVARLQQPRVDAHVGDLPALHHGNLEGKRRERRAVARWALLLGLRDGVHAPDGRDVFRRRQVIDDGIQDELDPLVAKRRPAQDGHDFEGDGGFSDRPDQLGLRDGLLGQILLGNPVIGLGDRFQQALAAGLGLRANVLRDLGDVEGRPQGVLPPRDEPHADQVDDPPEMIGFSEGGLDGQWHGCEALPHHLHGVGEVRADPVHLVDEGNLGDAVLVGLVPDGLRLRLHALHGGEDHDGAVENPEAALDLDREVHVPRGVDDMDLVVAPVAGGHGGRDGDPPLLLLGHPVHDGLAVVDLAHLVGLARVVENPLRDRRLPRVDVGDDPDVPDSRQLHSCHGYRVACGRRQSFPASPCRERRRAAYPPACACFAISLSGAMGSRRSMCPLIVVTSLPPTWMRIRLTSGRFPARELARE